MPGWHISKHTLNIVWLFTFNELENGLRLKISVCTFELSWQEISSERSSVHHQHMEGAPHTLLGDMPIIFIGNYFVTFVYRYQVLGFIGNYFVCELPIKSIGKCFITAI